MRLWRQLAFVKIVCNASIRTVAESPRWQRWEISNFLRSNGSMAACLISKTTNTSEYLTHAWAVEQKDCNKPRNNGSKILFQKYRTLSNTLHI